MRTPQDKDVHRERLRAENADLRWQNEELARRVVELERWVRELGGSAKTERLDED